MIPADLPKSFLSRRLQQDGPEVGLVDIGALGHLDVSHELALTLEKPLRVLQRRSSEEAELHVVRRGPRV